MLDMNYIRSSFSEFQIYNIYRKLQVRLSHLPSNSQNEKFDSNFCQLTLFNTLI